MASAGILICSHTCGADKLTAELIKKSDLILVMSKNQKKHLEQTWPFAKGKVFRLGHWQESKCCPILINMIKLFLMKLVQHSEICF